jgi:putative transcriptional regulator
MTTITSRIRNRDGALVTTHPDGRVEIVEKRPVREMTEKEIHAAALRDPDARPWSAGELRRAKTTPGVRVIRRALKLSQEEFAATFQIPLGTLRDWEQGRKEPDAAARAYLKVIARNPSAVAKALHASEQRPGPNTGPNTGT